MTKHHTSEDRFRHMSPLDHGRNETEDVLISFYHAVWLAPVPLFLPDPLEPRKCRLRVEGRRYGVGDIEIALDR
jgi:hypothetical protein